MANDTDLSLAISGAGGGTRKARAARPRKERAAAPAVAAEPEVAAKPVSLSVQCPAQVRNQMKALAAERGITLQQLFFEGFNDLFAKYGKPEIAPASSKA